MASKTTTPSRNPAQAREARQRQGSKASAEGRKKAARGRAAQHSADAQTARQEQAQATPALAAAALQNTIDQQLLALVADDPGTTTSLLAPRMQVKPQALAPRVRRLVNAGQLVKREDGGLYPNSTTASRTPAPAPAPGPEPEAPATVPTKVAARQVQVGDQLATKKGGPYQLVASAVHHDRSSVLKGQGLSIKPRHDTMVWVLRPEAAPAPAPAANPAEQAAEATREQLQAEHDALLANNAGMTGKQAARLKELRLQLGIGQAASGGTRTGGTRVGTVRDERLSGLAKAALNVATKGGAKVLADKPQPGNMKKAEAYLKGLGILGDVAGGLHTTRAQLGKLATGEKKRVDLADEAKAAVTAFGQHDPANFNGRRGAAILAAIHDAHKGE